MNVHDVEGKPESLGGAAYEEVKKLISTSFL
jgi:hypothetical protein